MKITYQPNSLYRLQQPKKWQAGTVDDDPFYYRCATCGSDEISGFLTGGDGEIALIRSSEKSIIVKNAMYCEQCMTDLRWHTG